MKVAAEMLGMSGVEGTVYVLPHRVLRMFLACAEADWLLAQTRYKRANTKIELMRRADVAEARFHFLYSRALEAERALARKLLGMRLPLNWAPQHNWGVLSQQDALA